ncbi:hypothetical protein C3L33_16161, partial [Rhododendron williamsianum]
MSVLRYSFYRAPSVFSILLVLLRDSPNYKIRIQAAAALAVPVTTLDYGGSFSDVIQGVELALENLINFNHAAFACPCFKQQSSTYNGFSCQRKSKQKASFLEEWLKVLCLSLGETSTELESENNCMVNQKKDMISRATWSLAKVYKSRNHMATTHKFEELASSEP